MKAIKLTSFFLFFTLLSFAQAKEVVIKTSAECTSCKERLEEKLNYTKGVKFCDLDVDSQLLTIRFDSKKIHLEEIKKIISDLGYDADELKANPDAQNKLPACCKPGAHH